jgi:hypothetical protein
LWLLCAVQALINELALVKEQLAQLEGSEQLGSEASMEEEQQLTISSASMSSITSEGSLQEELKEEQQLTISSAISSSNIASGGNGCAGIASSSNGSISSNGISSSGSDNSGMILETDPYFGSSSSIMESGLTGLSFAGNITNGGDDCAGMASSSSNGSHGSSSSGSDSTAMLGGSLQAMIMRNAEKMGVSGLSVTNSSGSSSVLGTGPFSGSSNSNSSNLETGSAGLSVGSSNSSVVDRYLTGLVRGSSSSSSSSNSNNLATGSAGLSAGSSNSVVDSCLTNLFHGSSSSNKLAIGSAGLSAGSSNSSVVDRCLTGLFCGSSNSSTSTPAAVVSQIRDAALDSADQHIAAAAAKQACEGSAMGADAGSSGSVRAAAACIQQQENSSPDIGSGPQQPQLIEHNSAAQHSSPVVMPKTPSAGYDKMWWIG